MRHYLPFEIIIPVTKIPSVNSAHKIGRTGNKAWIYLSKEIKDLQDTIKSEMINSGSKDWCKFLNKDCVLYVDIIYCFKNRFWVRDATNLTKYVEDAIAMAIDFNDAKNLKVNAEKVLNDVNSEEFIVLSITPHLLESVKYKWSQFTNET